MKMTPLECKDALVTKVFIPRGPLWSPSVCVDFYRSDKKIQYHSQIKLLLYSHLNDSLENLFPSKA